jgi:hypothetical protein
MSKKQVKGRLKKGGRKAKQGERKAKKGEMYE